MISRLQTDTSQCTSQARLDAKLGLDLSDVSTKRPVEHDSHQTALLAQDEKHLSTMDAGNRAEAAGLKDSTDDREPPLESNFTGDQSKATTPTRSTATEAGRVDTSGDNAAQAEMGAAEGEAGRTHGACDSASPPDIPFEVAEVIEELVETLELLAGETRALMPTWREGDREPFFLERRR